MQDSRNLQRAAPLWQCDKKKALPYLQLETEKWSIITPGNSVTLPLNTLITAPPNPSSKLLYFGITIS